MESEIRFTESADAIYLDKWLQQDGSRIGFPAIKTDLERADSVAAWIVMAMYKSSLTYVIDGLPVGIATLVLNPNQRLAHCCELSIVVDVDYRGRGIGTKLIKELVSMAKKDFSLETISLWVSEGNIAKNLYHKCGFKEVAFHPKWVKFEDGTYCGRYLMEMSI